MKTLSTYITEKLVINKTTKLSREFRVDNLIDKNVDKLFCDMPLDSDTLKYSSIIGYYIKYTISDILDIKLNADTARNCLIDCNMYDKDNEKIYIPDEEYYYIDDIENNLLVKYTKKQNSKPSPGYDSYDIYYLQTNKYFILRLVLTNKTNSFDFVIPL